MPKNNETPKRIKIRETIESDATEGLKREKNRTRED